MANRLCVFFKERGLLPVNDAPFRFLTSPPERIGDEALIEAGGRPIKVMLLRSSGHVNDETYLVASNGRYPC